MKIICFIKTIWSSIKSFPYITSGHEYIDVTDKYSKEYKNKNVQILECQLCHHISVGFKGE